VLTLTPKVISPVCCKVPNPGPTLASMAGESGVFSHSCDSDWPMQTVFSCPFLASRLAVSCPCSHACISPHSPNCQILTIDFRRLQHASGRFWLRRFALPPKTRGIPPGKGVAPVRFFDLSKLQPIFPERSESVLAREGRRTAWVSLKLHLHNSLAAGTDQHSPLSASPFCHSRFRCARTPSLGPLGPLCRAPRSSHRWGSLYRKDAKDVASLTGEALLLCPKLALNGC
jgi:hypothetical protein